MAGSEQRSQARQRLALRGVPTVEETPTSPPQLRVLNGVGEREPGAATAVIDFSGDLFTTVAEVSFVPSVAQPIADGPITRVARRTFDLTVALVLAVLTFPVLAMLAVGSAFSFRAWPFFLQRRVGREGKMFRFVKIRSLPPESPMYADKYQLRQIDTTRFGRFLRRSHLDELPQLWLVIAGRMSLVGPRPEMAVLSDAFSPSFVSIRTSIRPGCTGLWQVSPDAASLIGETPEYDEFYVRYRTLRLDLWILWRTVVQVFAHRSTPLDAVPGWALVAGGR